MIIYKLTSPSGHVYIGKTKQTLDVRYSQHITLWKCLSEKEDATLTKLHHAFNKYPPETWKKEIILECSEDEIDAHEITQIAIHNSYKLGYNSTLGGDGINGLIFTQKHKANIAKAKSTWWQSEKGIAKRKELSEKMKINNPSKFQKGKPAWNTGKTMPPVSNETRIKISQKLKGKIRSPEHSANIGKAKKGTKQTPDHIQKRADAVRGFRQSDKQKAAVEKANSCSWEVITPDGQILTIHNLSEYCKSVGVDQGNLSRGHSKGYKAKKLTEKGSSTLYIPLTS